MRKIYKLIIILTLSLFLANIVHAEVKIQSFVCFYKMKSNINDNLGNIQIMVSNYNDGNGPYSYNVFYQNANGFTEYKGGSIDDYVNYDNNGSKYIMMFCGGQALCNKVNSDSMKSFTNYFVGKGTCSPIYYNYVNEMTDRVEINAINPDDNIKLDSYSIKFKVPGGTEWITKEELDKKTSSTPPTTTTNNDLSCNYKMHFDLLNNTSSVNFTKKTNEYNGNVTYSITIDGVEETLRNLEETFVMQIGQYTGGQVKITSEDLYKIFNRSECLNSKDIYHYLESQNSDAFIYYITLDPQKAYDEGTANRVGDGSGEKPSQEIGQTAIEKQGKKPEVPDGGFGSGYDKCTTLLGPNLTKIVSVGITAIQIIGAILAIVKGMITLIPAIMAKDSDGLKKSQKKLVLMAIILLCIFLLRYLVRWIGSILGYDISCIV